MKKTILTLALTIVCSMFALAQTTLRQNINQTINRLNIYGNTNAKVIADRISFIDVIVPDANIPLLPGAITIDANALTIRNIQPNFQYEVHLNAEDLLTYTFGPSTKVEFANSDFPAAMRSSSVNSWSDGTQRITVHDGDTSYSNDEPVVIMQPYGLVDQLQRTFADMNNETRQTFDSLSNIFRQFSAPAPTIATTDTKPHYDAGDRTDADFLWGFTNWGSAPLSGLMKMPGNYELHTSFSSYQLGFNYAFLMSRHWKFKVGINYESDIYKFTTDFVNFVDPGTGTSLEQIAAADRPIAGDNWSTKLVTRYISLPISIGYRAGDKHFTCNLSVVPGLGFCGKHTGMKHTLKKRGTDYKDTESIADLLNPYKCDIRLDFGRYGGLKCFVQAPLLPVFVDPNLPKVYPIKIGFMI